MFRLLLLNIVFYSRLSVFIRDISGSKIVREWLSGYKMRLNKNILKVVIKVYFSKQARCLFWRIWTRHPHFQEMPNL